jgi:multidrug efflux pump subunit AcrA (membrane-fusion protein)
LAVYFTENWRWGNDDGIKEGSEVRERQTIITLPDTSQMKVEVQIHEASMGRLAIGQAASVEIEGTTDRTFSGRVSKVAPLAESRSRWLNPDLKEYTTEVLLDPTDADLKPGVTARVEIFIEEVTDRLAAPVQAVFSKGGRHYVFRQAGNEVEPVEVTLGSASSEFVVIEDGVAEGDQLLLAVSDDIQRLLPEPSAEPNRDSRPKPAEAQAERTASPKPQEAQGERPASPPQKGQSRPPGGGGGTGKSSRRGP